MKGIFPKMLLPFFKVGKIRAYLQVEEKRRQEKRGAEGARFQRGERRMDPVPGKERPSLRQEESFPEKLQVGGSRKN